MSGSASREFQDRLTGFLPTMRAWAMALTRNRAAAEDLVQDVAMKTLVASESFIPGHQFLRMGAQDHGQPLYLQRPQ
jgi:RNA polymerase sigma-70 factor (ECF subfamily)